MPAAKKKTAEAEAPEEKPDDEIAEGADLGTEPEERELTTDERVARMEKAINQVTDLSQFDPTDIVAERNETIRKANEKMVEIAHQAAEDISENLTLEQRLERLETFQGSTGRPL